MTNRFEFPFRLRLVDVRYPLAWPIKRPGSKKVRIDLGSMLAPPHTTPSPVLSTLTKTGSQRIAFDVTQDGQQVLVFLDGKGLEPTLIEMAGPLRVMMGVPTHRMGVGQPPKESGNLMLRFRANNEMPVIGHHAIRKDWQFLSLERFNDNPFERIIVFRFLEQRQSSDCSIEHMEAYTSRANTGSSRHLAKLTTRTG